MTGVLTAGLQTWAQAITAWAIAVFAVAVALVIFLGFLRAWVARLRPQVVIPDVELDEGVPAEAVAGLSRQFRDTVRRALRRQSDDARLAEMETIQADIAAGLVTVRGTTTMMTMVAELDWTTRDSMSKLSAGFLERASRPGW